MDKRRQLFANNFSSRAGRHFLIMQRAGKKGDSTIKALLYAKFCEGENAKPKNPNSPKNLLIFIDIFPIEIYLESGNDQFISFRCDH